MSPALTSYLKTTVACFALVLTALACSILVLFWLPRTVALALATLAILMALGAAIPASAGALVIYRYRRSARRQRDIFLELNRSREAAAIKAAGPTRVTRLRRWLARRLLGHELVVGDLVEIRPWAEIRATLDERGCLEELPFMPEMLAMCGQRAYVFRCVHRLFDYRKSRRMRHMDDAVLLTGAVCNGSSHGGCDAACHVIWKSAWLRRIERSSAAHGMPPSSGGAEAALDSAVLSFGTRAPRYQCQLTQLDAASQPIANWSPLDFLRPLVAGNVTLTAFVVARLTYLFNELQHLRGGIIFPTFEAAAGGAQQEMALAAGDRVMVRSSGEIRATLNDQLEHRGMGFESDMLKHCGRELYVQAEVKKVIDIVSGEMRTMKTPAYVLRDVHFSGERQLFNAQYEPLFWRSAWLQRTHTAAIEGSTCSPRCQSNAKQ